MSDIDKVLDYLARDGYGTPIGVLESVPAARAEVHALREEVGTARELLIDVFDLWDDNAIEHSTPENYMRAREVFDRILEVLPPEKRDAVLGRRGP